MNIINKTSGSSVWPERPENVWKVAGSNPDPDDLRAIRETCSQYSTLAALERVKGAWLQLCQKDAPKSVQVIAEPCRATYSAKNTAHL